MKKQKLPRKVYVDTDEKQSYLMYLTWKKLKYPTFQVLGDMFNIHRRTASHHIGKWLAMERKQKIEHDNKSITLIIKSK